MNLYLDQPISWFKFMNQTYEVRLTFKENIRDDINHNNQRHVGIFIANYIMFAPFSNTTN